ncbi:hypothetical protein NDA13_002199 [Ustilago tritici]|nr:hypothetical protein NDA13_002199 [Ustilago tritici]
MVSWLNSEKHLLPLPSSSTTSLSHSQQEESEMYSASPSRRKRILKRGTMLIIHSLFFQQPEYRWDEQYRVEHKISDNPCVNGESVIHYDQAFFPTGLKGILFSTFFGGSTREWATPVDQFSYFAGFSVRINSVES